MSRFQLSTLSEVCCECKGEGSKLPVVVAAWIVEIKEIFAFCKF